MTDLIEVPIDALASPSKTLILSDSAFLSTLKSVEEQVAALKITDAQSAQAAANLTARLTTAGKALDKQRMDLKRPFMDMAAKIDAAARAPAARIDAAKATLSRLQTAYATEQARLAREAEAKRQADLAALEKKRQEEAEAEAARVSELQKQAEKKGTVVLEDDEEVVAPPPTETEQKIAAVMAAPAVVAPKPSGVRMKVTLDVAVTDVNLLPDVFIQKTAKIQAIKAAYCTGWAEGQPIPNVPGLAFEVKRTVESTGRGAF